MPRLLGASRLRLINANFPKANGLRKVDIKNHSKALSRRPRGGAWCLKEKQGSEVTQKEIIEFEEANTGVIRLYLEGSFYKAYERSAFAFCTRIKDYRVLRKESKTLGRDILYVGFPMTALDRTLGNAMTRKVNEVVIDVVLSYPISENEFLQWRVASRFSGRWFLPMAGISIEEASAG